VPGIGHQRHRTGEETEYGFDHDEGGVQHYPDGKGPAVARRAMVVMAVPVPVPVVMMMMQAHARLLRAALSHMRGVAATGGFSPARAA